MRDEGDTRKNNTYSLQGMLKIEGRCFRVVLQNGCGRMIIVFHVSYVCQYNSS